MSGRRVVVPLKETVERSDAVVVAVPADPPERVIDIPIGPEFPAYSRRLYRYRVEDVLRGELKPGAEIEVDHGSWGYFFKAHQLRYVERIHKILLYEDYDSTLQEKENDPRLILLLKEKEGERWEFSCGMSLEPVRMRARIEKLLGA